MQNKKLTIRQIVSFLNDEELWKLENFERFIEARKTLIVNKFSYMLRSTGGNP